MTLEFAVNPALNWTKQEIDDRSMPLDVSDNATWRVIDSPYRMRLFEMIRRSDGVTINELANLASTNPVNLYYHIRTLEAHKLIKAVGHREGVARRAPVIYAATMTNILLSYNPNSKLDVERISHLRKSWIREAETSLTTPPLTSANEDMSLFRWEMLTEGQHDEIARHLERVSMILDEARDCAQADEKHRLHYIGFQIADVPKETLPAPRIRAIAEETMKDRTTRSNVGLVESKLQA